MFTKNGFGLGRLGLVNSTYLLHTSSVLESTSFLGRSHDQSSRTRCTAHPSIYTRQSFKSRESSCQGLHTSVSCRSEEKTTQDKNSTLAEEMRKTMWNMPAPVVVVTSRTSVSPPPDPKDSFAGMTVSSFTCLSLDPYPMISFNIRMPSSTLSAIRSSRQFWVHVLDGSWRGAHIADAFTGGAAKFEAPVKASTGARLWELSETGLPLLLGKGVTRILGCALLGKGEDGLLRVGDHVLVLGRVVDVGRPGNAWREDCFKGLCYLQGKYLSPGKAIAMRLEWVKGVGR